MNNIEIGNCSLNDILINHEDINVKYSRDGTQIVYVNNIKFILSPTFPNNKPKIYINDKLYNKPNNSPLTFYLNKTIKSNLYLTSVTNNWTITSNIMNCINEIEFINKIKKNSVYWLAIQYLGKKFRMAEDMDYIIMDYCR